jgi:hypothetical protein
MSVYCCKRIFCYDSVRKLLDTPSYIFLTSRKRKSGVGGSVGAGKRYESEGFGVKFDLPPATVLVHIIFGVAHIGKRVFQTT